MEGNDTTDFYYHSGIGDSYETTSANDYASGIYGGGGDGDGYYNTNSYADGSSSSYKKEDVLDYTALSVLAVTLGLLMIVETFWHHLDHKAVGRPFFQSVLNMVHRELATLGVIELFVHLMYEYYYELIDKDKKAVFADIHFALFYTAILNALQSVILCFFTTRVAHAWWVQTEEVEVNHYVELREEFVRLEVKLSGGSNKPTASTRKRNIEQWWDAEENDDDGEEFFTMTGKVQQSMREIKTSFRYPHLKWVYDKLLVQIKFHELRIHFLEAYNLPLNLKISGYLMRSQQQVMLKLVHVSASALLWLTACAIFMYYIKGMIVVSTHDKDAMSGLLGWLLFAAMFFMLWASILCHYKLERIFRTIIHMKLFWNENDDIDKEEAIQHANEQLSLFWFSDPTLFISTVQFFQFFYGLAISSVIVYWDHFNKGSLGSWHYVLSIIICYVLFVIIMAQAIPRFTLCTSLGRLVDKQRLQETVAKYRLEEATRAYRQRLELQELDNDFADLNVDHGGGEANAYSSVSSNENEVGGVGVGRVKTQRNTAEQNNKVTTSTDKTLCADSDQAECLPHPNSCPDLTTMDDDDSLIAPTDLNKKQPSQSVDQASLLAELVRSRTSQLRQALPQETQDRLNQRRKNRRKTVSAGVSSMRNLKNFFDMDDTALQSDTLHSSNTERTFSQHNDDLLGSGTSLKLDDNEQKNSRRRNRRLRSKSAGVDLMFMMNDDKIENLCEKASNPATSIDDSNIISRNGKKTRPRRLRAVSAGVGMMRMMQDGIESLTAKNANSINMNDDNVSLQSKRNKASEAITADETTISNAVDATKKVDSNASENTVTNDNRAAARQNRINSRRQARKRSVSLGVEYMIVKEDESVPSYNNANAMVIKDTIPIDAKKQPVLQTTPTRSNATAAEDNLASILTTTPSIVATGNMVYPYKDGGDDDDESTAGHSDFSDIPEARVNDSLHNGVTIRPSLMSKLSDQLHSYYLSDSYPSFSNLFETMVCFYFIGARVEGFVQLDDILPWKDISFGFGLETAFWVELGMYVFFALQTLLILNTSSSKTASKEHKNSISILYMSVILDVLIITTCLLLLLVAESVRCCVGNDLTDDDEDERLWMNNLPNYNDRSLAGEYYDKQGVQNHYSSEDCTCPAFGSRTYGGLGILEPFTALVALRACRFYFARIVVDLMDARSQTWMNKSGVTRTTIGMKHAHGHGGGHGDHDDNGGHGGPSVVELWEQAVSKHADIVEKHGEFSGELLQAMLGIYVGDDHHATSTEKPKLHEHDNETATMTTEVTTGAAEKVGTSNSANRVSFSNQQANQLNQGVKNMNPEPSLLPSNQNHFVASADSMITKPGNASLSMPSLRQLSSSKLSSRRISSISNISNRPPMSIPESDEITDFMEFTMPTARLVRSMRRCDKKFLPFCENWLPVDVVITKHEIVYFEAIGVDDSIMNDYMIPSDSERDVLDESTREARRIKREEIKEELRRTKGGKGLRLCDVAAGRKMVGHLPFTDILTVHVVKEATDGDATTSSEEDYNIKESEYWLPPKQAKFPNNIILRSSRWAKVDQCWLKVETTHGRLLLRFYSDLEDLEANLGQKVPKNNASNEEVDLDKNNSLLWAETIVRCRGPQHLKQSLPHFGTGDDDELRDLVVDNSHHDTIAPRRTAFSRLMHIGEF